MVTTKHAAKAQKKPRGQQLLTDAQKSRLTNFIERMDDAVLQCIGGVLTTDQQDAFETTAPGQFLSKKQVLAYSIVHELSVSFGLDQESPCTINTVEGLKAAITKAKKKLTTQITDQPENESAVALLHRIHDAIENLILSGPQRTPQGFTIN